MRKFVFLQMIFAVLLFAVCAAGDPSIRLKYATFDPLTSLPDVPHDLRSIPVSGEPGYYLVQFVGSVEPEWRNSVEVLGADILDYIPDYAFVVRMTPETADQVARLDHVRWVGPFHPAYRMAPELLKSKGSLKVRVRSFRGHGPESLRNEIAQVGGRVGKSSSHAGGGAVEATIPAGVLRRLARQTGVAWIEPKLEYKLCNNSARNIIATAGVWTDLGVYGNGETVAVVDTGLDIGEVGTLSPDFSGRVAKYYTLGRPGRWDDPHGHGTHVTGSIVGTGVMSGSAPFAHSYTSSYAGVAPEARVIVQSIIDDDGQLTGIPADLNQIMQPPYSDGARIQTHSWGTSDYGAYTVSSRDVDSFTWNHRDMVVVTAAGNDGVDADGNGVVDLDSMNSPATAKNCISVGASEGYRLYGGASMYYSSYWPADFPASPIKTDRLSNNSSGVAAFSSRGPCDDGRLKPDICAPGTNIISCRSHQPGSNTLWGVYSTEYLYCGGTSMSAPMVAGAAALTREYYRMRVGIMPSAALVKATLINGAKDITPGQYGTSSYLEVPTRPNNVEGWGRLDIANSIRPTGLREVRYVDNATGLNTGGSANYTYSITGATSPIRVTLVWTDYPGSTAASNALVNDLDLVVVAPNGTVMHGNYTEDHINNVEGVDIAAPLIGTYTVTVNAYNVPFGPQPYALVVSGDLSTGPPIASITCPTSGLPVCGSLDIMGTAGGPNFQQYTLEYGVGSSPTSWTPVCSTQTTPVMNGCLGTLDMSAFPDGQYTIRLRSGNMSNEWTEATTTMTLQRTSLVQAKGRESGTPVTLTGMVVSGSKQEFGTYMYVQEQDRTSGVRITIGSPCNAVIGSIITVSGTMGYSNGERVILYPTVTVTGSTSEPAPLGMSNLSLGGVGLNILTPGVTGGIGPHNLCLLVRAWGKVTAIEGDHFYIDDGSGISDGSGNVGIKVFAGSLPKPMSTSQYAIVTGLSSAEVASPITRRVLRPRRESDIMFY